MDGYSPVASNGFGPAPLASIDVGMDSRRVGGFHENGRFYGGFRRGHYLFPCDEAEKERLDIFHKFFLVARDDKLHSAPLLNTHNPRVLDLGCGTGIWSIDMGDQYPGAHVCGVDLEYIQPEFIPPNLRFQQMDIEGSWETLGGEKWDLIHMRALCGSVVNWPNLYAETWRALKPHIGHVEQVEISWIPDFADERPPPNSMVSIWANEVMKAMDILERPMRVEPERIKSQMRDAGFVEVKETVVMVPYSGWPTDHKDRETGRWFALGLNQGLHALTIGPLFRGLNKSPQEVNDLITRVKDEILQRQHRAFCKLHIFTGRKP